jgi:hypothetical protein
VIGRHGRGRSGAFVGECAIDAEHQAENGRSARELHFGKTAEHVRT